MTFAELRIGQEFDFVSPIRMLNTFYDRCVKTSERKYKPLDGALKGFEVRIGSIKAAVFNYEAVS